MMSLKIFSYDSRPALAVALILVAAFAYWLWFGATQVSLDNDGFISVHAAQSILEHGYPLLPSGYIYDRSYLPHYILAGFLGVFGSNDLSIFLPSILAGLGSLWLVYLIARDILGKKWVGVAAIALLVVLQVETYYATNPRMYLPLQFITLIAVYSAWRGYIQGEGKFRIITFIAIAAALLTHKEAGALPLSIPISVLVALWGMKRGFRTLYSWQTIAGLLLVSIVAYLALVYRSPNSMPIIVGWSGLDPGSSGILHIDPRVWARQIFQLELSLPFLSALIPISVYIVATSLWRRKGEEHNSLTYILLLFAISAVPILTATSVVGQRFWVFLLPLYSLLAMSGAAVVFETLGITKKHWMVDGLGGKRAVGILLAIGVMINLGLVGLADRTSHSDLVRQSFLLPCQVELKCIKSNKTYYDELNHQIASVDKIITTNPMVDKFYLGRVDGILREQIILEGSAQSLDWKLDDIDDSYYRPFDVPTDEYLAIPVIDTLEELQELLESEQRVWILADRQSSWSISDKTLAFIDSNFTTLNRQGHHTTYVNHDDGLAVAN